MKTQGCLTPHDLLNRNETHTVTIPSISPKLLVPDKSQAGNTLPLFILSSFESKVTTSFSSAPQPIPLSFAALGALCTDCSMSPSPHLYCVNPQCQEYCTQVSWHLADLTSNANEEEGGEAAGGLLPGRMGSGPAGQVRGKWILF